MIPNWLRLAYVAELLLAIPAVYTLWSQVGGQGHLDMMPWYWKLALGGAMSIACVFATVAVVGHDRAFNRPLILWIALIVLIGVGMGLVTYYYHLHEEVDQGDEEESTQAMLSWERPA